MDALIKNATLTRQSYGIAMAQVTYGGPRGIWLECTTCNESQVIVGSNSDEWAKVPTERCVEVFTRHGWTGEGPTLKKARCPRCSTETLGGVFASYQEAKRLAPVCGEQQLVEAGRKVALAVRGDFSHK